MTPRFTRGLAAGLALAVAATGRSASLRAERTPPLDLSQPWVAATPEEVQMDGPALAVAAGRAAGVPRFRSLLVARHGRLVVERYFGLADAGTSGTEGFGCNWMFEFNFGITQPEFIHCRMN